jgi:hypothetical protein
MEQWTNAISYQSPICKNIVMIVLSVDDEMDE